MSTIWRFREKWKVAIYPGDHAPPHFHVLGPDCGAVFDIATLSRVRGEGPEAILREVLERAAAEKSTLLKAWCALNDHEDES